MVVVVVVVAVGVAATREIGAATVVGTGADALGGTGADAAGATGDSLGVDTVGAGLPPPSMGPWQHEGASGFCGMCGVEGWRFRSDSTQCVWGVLVPEGRAVLGGTGSCGSGGVLLLAPATAAASFEAVGAGAGPGMRAHYCWSVMVGGHCLMAVLLREGVWGDGKDGMSVCAGGLCVAHCQVWLSVFGHSSFVCCTCAAADTRDARQHSWRLWSHGHGLCTCKMRCGCGILCVWPSRRLAWLQAGCVLGPWILGLKHWWHMLAVYASAVYL